MCCPERPVARRPSMVGGQDMSSVPVPVLFGPHGPGIRGLFPVSEDDGPDYREHDCQAYAEDEEGAWERISQIR